MEKKKKAKAVPKPRKPRVSKVPKVRNASTMTEAQFWAWIRFALRQKSRWWKPIGIVRVKARRPYKGPLKSQKWEYQCNKCKKWFIAKDTNVDHITPAGSLNCAEDLPGFVERLFTEEEGLQLLCTNCHDIKTENEKK